MTLHACTESPHSRLRSSGSLPVPQSDGSRLGHRKTTPFMFQKYPGVAKRRGKAPAEVCLGLEVSS